MSQIYDPLKLEVDWSYRTILIVEDVYQNYKFLKTALEKTKAKIRHASDGQEAVSMCTEDKNIDLVLMDLHLPRMSGLAATKEIKKNRKDITVIAQTAFVLSGERDICLQAGCDEYIPKPIRSNELIVKIRNCLIKQGKEA
ncbi:MAG: response regulator [Bacteroidales bacterium]